MIALFDGRPVRGGGPATAWRSALRVSLLAVAMASLPAAVAAQEYHVDLEAQNQVRFISQAPIEDFEGVTGRIDGYVLLGEGGLAVGSTRGSEFYLEVDLASLDTGIGLRNRHMRDNYLETDEYPYATFSGSFAEVTDAGNGSYRVVADGTMGIHGVAREMEIPCDVSPSGREYRVRCGFQVLLSDFDIEIPKVMFMKLSEEIRLELDFYVEPASMEGS